MRYSHVSAVRKTQVLQTGRSLYVSQEITSLASCSSQLVFRHITSPNADSFHCGDQPRGLQSRVTPERRRSVLTHAVACGKGLSLSIVLSLLTQ